MALQVLTRLAVPPGSLLLLALIGLVFRLLGWKKSALLCVAVAFAGLWALSTPKVADALARGLESQVEARPVEQAAEVDAIVVLGGGLAPALQPRLGPDLNEAADRILHAARLYRAGKAPLVVATGGYAPWTGGAPPEGEGMADLLVEWGVPRESILVETGSRDTHENVVRVAKLLDEHHARRILLVTSALHMPRALAVFKRTGLVVIPSPTDFQAVEGGQETILDWVPRAHALDVSARALHEHIGRLWYDLRGWTK
ncbi:MAG: YdcF family protein [Planctomycetota bacterium]